MSKRAKTVEEAIFAIMERHPWTEPWWQRGCLVIETPTSTFEVKHVEGVVSAADAPVPSNMTALSCAGWDDQHLLRWVGWDFDVGKGRPAKWQADLGMSPYATTDEAITAARRLRDALDRRAEIRLSRSGVGVHVRHLLGTEEGSHLKSHQAGHIARCVAAELKIYTDPAQLGRQCMALWCRNRKPESFRLIEEHA
ncbi:MAG: hypothetical protein HS116_24880 [Planctomycetes bacterium]|nr:hypothetical protein [Planctomycetota bacterium]